MSAPNSETVKRAHRFIMDTINEIVTPKGSPPIRSDANLANVLGGTLELKDQLSLLRQGKSIPGRRLIKAFRNFVGPMKAKDEIDEYLIKPFGLDVQD